MLRMICIPHIQPRKPVLDHAEYTAPTRQYEPVHTDYTDQECIYPERSIDHEMGVGDPPEVCILPPSHHFLLLVLLGGLGRLGCHQRLGRVSP